MENILSGKVENMIIYQDDICIETSSEKEMEQNQNMFWTHEKKPVWL